MKIFIDFETYSEADLKNVGAWAYSRHPSTKVLCLAIKIEGLPPTLYTGMASAKEQIALLINGDHKVPVEIHAYNSFFECAIIANVLGFGADAIDFTQWRDTMACTVAATFPAALGKAAIALGLPQDKQKDKAGRQLIQKLCKPQKVTNKKGADTITPQEKHGDQYSELLRQLGEYCLQDVVAEEEVSNRVLPLSKDEQAVWVEDQRINWRGMKIDVELCTAALRMYEQAKERDLKKIATITHLENPNSRAQVQKWLKEQGCNLPNMQASTLKNLIETDLPVEVKKVIRLRLNSSRTPPTKFAKLIGMADPEDGRVRGLLSYHGATTGRWASRLINTQNLPRPSIDEFESPIRFVMDGDLDLLETFYGPSIDVLCSLIRPALTASDGGTLFGPDYSSIESRCLNWVSGATDTLRKIQDGDEVGDSSRVYKIAASGVFGLPPEEVRKGSDEYQGGKATELACGYQGSVAALGAMSTNLGIKIVAPEGFKLPTKYHKARDWHRDFRKKKKQDPMTSTEEYQLYLVKKWREANPKPVQFWQDVQNAAIAAVQTPNQVIKVNKNISFKCGRYKGNNYLWCRLPSGRVLSYVNPYLREDEDFGLGLRFWAVDSTNKQWRRHYTHGGKLTENIVQAIARDVLAYGKLRLRGTAFDNIVLSVHDEYVNDVTGEEDMNDLCDLICQNEPWMEGLPLTASGSNLPRYWK